MEEIVGLVQLMLESGLPCFKAHTIENLRSRFAPELPTRAAAEAMIARVKESLAQVSRTTLLYDQFQHLQNEISY
jgi:phosphatidylinositol 4-kinase A